MLRSFWKEPTHGKFHLLLYLFSFSSFVAFSGQRYLSRNITLLDCGSHLDFSDLISHTVIAPCLFAFHFSWGFHFLVFLFFSPILSGGIFYTFILNLPSKSLPPGIMIFLFRRLVQFQCLLYGSIAISRDCFPNIFSFFT